MGRWSKKVLGILLIGSMTLGMTACGGDSAGSKANNEEAKKYVYKGEEIDLGLLPNSSGINAMNYVNDRLYVMATESNWETEPMGNTVYLISCAGDGSDMQKTKIVEPTGDPNSNIYMGNIQMTDTNIFATVEDAYNDYSDEENPISEYSIDLVSWDLTGKEVWRQNIVPKDAEGTDAEGMYIQMMVADANGGLMLFSSKGLFVYDNTGALKSTETDTAKMEEMLGITSSMFMDKEDGKLKMIAWNADYTKQSLRTYNLETKSFEADVELTANLSGYGLNPGKKYDFILTNQLGIAGYNVGDTEVTQIMNVINSDIDCSDFSRVQEIDDESFIGVYNDTVNYNMHIARFTYVDPKDIPDKQVFTLASYWIDSDIKQRVIEYNKNSDKYRIMIKDYSEYRTNEDYLAGYTQLNNDIISGKMPDILILDDNMPIESYVSKGVLADINSMIEKDETLKRDDFMTNVFDAYSKDGKLYRLISSFYVMTVAGKTSEVGAEPGWTLKELQDIMAAKPEGTQIFSDFIRDDMLSYAMGISRDQFIDKATGKCNFNSQAFTDLLEFAKQFPAEYDNTKYEDPNFWEQQQAQYREGKVLLANMQIRDFNSLASMEQGEFGEPITFIGFPTENGVGSVIAASKQFGISAKSANKEAAWDFLRYYLTDEYQTTLNWELPVSRAAMEQLLTKATQKPYYEDENGNKVEYDQNYWIGDTEIKIDPLTKERTEYIYSFLSSLDQVYYWDQNLLNIIKEEAAAFFAGQKTAADVANIIQSRAQIYVDENR